MAPGYLIAAFCEVAGLLGILAALAVSRAERRAKASELRGVLRTGQPASGVPASGAGYRQPAIPVRLSSLPVTPLQPRDPMDADSEARSALLRAIPRAA